LEGTRLKLEKLLDQCSSALVDHADLKVTQAQAFPLVLEGMFELDSPKGPVDAYQIRVEIPETFPFASPRVFETGGRIPWEIDRHVFSDGRACLEVWPVWRAKNPDANVRTVLNGPVRNFLLSQSVFEATKEWPFGDYAHGSAGQREALRSVLGAPTPEDRDLLWRLHALLSPPRRQNACPCNSGRLYRKCHADEMRKIADSMDEAGLWLMTEMYLGILERSKEAVATATEPLN
jgi:hypothetical protein